MMMMNHLSHRLLEKCNYLIIYFYNNNSCVSNIQFFYCIYLLMRFLRETVKRQCAGEPTACVLCIVAHSCRNSCLRCLINGHFHDYDYDFIDGRRTSIAHIETYVHTSACIRTLYTDGNEVSGVWSHCIYGCFAWSVPEHTL